VSKALTKEKEERYQTAKDLLIDLRRLQHRQESQAEMDRGEASGTGSEGRVRTDLTSAPVVSTNETAAPTVAATAHPTSSAEFLIDEVKRHKGWTLVVRAALVDVRSLELSLVSTGLPANANQASHPWRR